MERSLVDERIALDSRGLHAAMEVLRREQATYLPTKRESSLYRAFNVSAFGMVFAAVLLSAAAVMSTDSAADMFGEPALATATPAVLWVGGIVAVLSAVGTLVLFIMNLSLIRKLYRLARLRRRLKLVFDFAPAFSAERKTKRTANAFTIAMSVFGVLLALVGVVAVAGVAYVWYSIGTLSALTGLWLELFVAFSTLGIGLSFASLHFVRRGKHRLEVVVNLERTLGSQATDGVEGSAAATLSPAEYNALVGLERQQIMRDRASSIVAGRREAKAPGYICQTSREMYLEKSGLPPETLVKVEQTIADLLADPSVGSGDTEGSRAVAVAGTSLTVRYDVDSNRHLVRLLQLEGTSA